MSAALDAVWLEAGWGPRRASPVADHDPPLLFSLRWPQAWLVDELHVGDRVASSADSPLGRLRAWERVPAAIANQRVRLALPRDDGSEVVLLGTLSASLADVGELPPVGELGDDARAVTSAHYPGVRIGSLRAAALGDAGPYVEMRVLRVMLTTPYGLLALVFTALQPEFYDVMETMFDAVAQTARLDPCAF